MKAVAWDPDFFYQWPSFLILVIIYSAAVCSGELSKDGPQIFSKTNARPLLVILAIHACFLTILFYGWRFASFIDPRLPHFMTDRFSKSGSVLNITFLLVMFVVQLIERRWLVLKRDGSE